MSGDLLRVESLTVRFPRRGASDFTAVDDVTFTAGRGEALAVLGESGSGKSTLLRALARLLEPSSGKIQFEGADLARLRGAALDRARAGLQLVFQDPFASLDPRWTVAASVAEPLHRLDRAERRRRACEWLEAVGLAAGVADRYPHELSGGQRQRVAIARALAPEPRMLLLDEPTSALDVSVRAQIVNLLADLRARLAPAIVLVTHDLPSARVLCDRALVMEAGRIVEQGELESILGAPRSNAAKMLIDATPSRDPRAQRAKLAAAERTLFGSNG